jgi:hypothetical protein
MANPVRALTEEVLVWVGNRRLSEEACVSQVVCAPSHRPREDWHAIDAHCLHDTHLFDKGHVLKENNVRPKARQLV